MLKTCEVCSRLYAQLPDRKLSDHYCLVCISMYFYEYPKKEQGD